jgi:two-component system response regulator AtoC
VLGLAPEALARLKGYAWPGNVRELENAVERAMVMSDGDQIAAEALPDKLLGKTSAPLPEDELSIKKATRALEEGLIRRALQKTRGNRTRAAEILEISHRALLYKIKEFGIDPDAEGAKGRA